MSALPTDGPAARFGIQQGDQLVSIAGSLVTRNNWQSALERFRPGDRVKVQVERFGRTVDVELVMAAPANFTYRLEEIPNASAEAERLRASWLNGK